jgi:hypothetical protein
MAVLGSAGRYSLSTSLEQSASMTAEPLSIWTVYQRPADYPSKFVARRWLASASLVATDDVLIDDTLIALRGRLPPGLVQMPRDPSDDPSIVETWL